MQDEVLKLKSFGHLFPLGTDQGAFFHSRFRRDAPELLPSINQMRQSGKKGGRGNNRPMGEDLLSHLGQPASPLFSSGPARPKKPPSEAENPDVATQPAHPSAPMGSSPAASAAGLITNDFLLNPLVQTHQGDSSLGPSNWQNQYMHEQLQPHAFSQLQPNMEDYSMRFDEQQGAKMPESSSRESFPMMLEEGETQIGGERVKGTGSVAYIQHEKLLNEMLIQNKQQQSELEAQRLQLEQQRLALQKLQIPFPAVVKDPSESQSLRGGFQSTQLPAVQVLYQGQLSSPAQSQQQEQGRTHGQVHAQYLEERDFLSLEQSPQGQTTKEHENDMTTFWK